MDTMHDRLAVQAVLGGNIEAYRSLVDHYYVGLTRYVYGLIGDEETSHDIAEDAFITAYQKLRLYNPKYTFPTWLYQIARGLADQDMKYHAAWSPDSNPADDQSGLPPEPPGHHIVSESLCRTMRRLRPDWRSAIQLYYWDDKTHDEIADLLDIKVSAVRTWLSRAKAVCRNEFNMLDDKEVNRCLIEERPRLRFSQDFTARVMERVRETKQRHVIPGRRLALAIVILLVVVGAGTFVFMQRRTIAVMVAGSSASQNNAVSDNTDSKLQSGKGSSPNYEQLAANAMNDVDSMSLQTGKFSDNDYADSQLADAAIY